MGYMNCMYTNDYEENEVVSEEKTTEGVIETKLSQDEIDAINA
jgi:hypothetical protein